MELNEYFHQDMQTDDYSYFIHNGRSVVVYLHNVTLNKREY